MGIAALLALHVLPRFTPVLGGTFDAPRGSAWQAEETKRLAAVNCLEIHAKPGPENDSPWTRDDAVLFRLTRARDHLSDLSERCSGGVSRACQAIHRRDHRDALIRYLKLRHEAYEAAYRKGGRASVAFLDQFLSSRTDAGIIRDNRLLLESGIEVKAFLSPAQRHYLELLIEHAPDPVPVCYRAPQR